MKWDNKKNQAQRESRRMQIKIPIIINWIMPNQSDLVRPTNWRESGNFHACWILEEKSTSSAWGELNWTDDRKDCRRPCFRAAVADAGKVRAEDRAERYPAAAGDIGIDDWWAGQRTDWTGDDKTYSALRDNPDRHWTWTYCGLACSCKIEAACFVQVQAGHARHASTTVDRQLHQQQQEKTRSSPLLLMAILMTLGSELEADPVRSQRAEPFPRCVTDKTEENQVLDLTMARHRSKLTDDE